MPITRPTTSMQKHVLANLERVVDKPYKLNVASPLRHYSLDGKECTAQITSLAVRGLVKMRDGRLERTSGPSANRGVHTTTLAFEKNEG